MSLRTTNLNLLPILHALLKEHSVSRAAAALNLSQPATSNALGRLRVLFNDPLLVAVGRDMRPTPRALALLPLLDTACSGLETLLLSPGFDAAQAVRRFVVAAPDYIALLASTALLPMLQASAPGITVQFVSARAGFVERLLNGEYDLAVVAPEPELVRGLQVSSRGLPDHMVAVVRRDHPLTQHRSPSLAQLCAWPELRGQPGSDSATPAHAPGWVPVGGGARLLTEQFMALPILAAQSDAVAFVPAALARFFIKLVPIVALEVPGHHAFSACAVWSPTQQADPGHQWFRALLEDALETCLRDPDALAHRPPGIVTPGT